MTQPVTTVDQAVTDLAQAVSPGGHVTGWMLSIHLLDDLGRERIHIASPIGQTHVTTVGLAVDASDYLRGNR